MRVTCAAVLVALVAVPAHALVRAYSVEPVQQSWSGKVKGDENHPISQIVTCCWDELDSTCYVELFVGANGDTGSYKLEVKDGNTVIASRTGVTPAHDYAWLKFGNIQMEPGESFTKGKRYEFRFTRSGSDSINYYYQTGDPYENRFGWLEVGGDHGTDWDLCMRVYGVMDAEGMRAEGGGMETNRHSRPTDLSASAV